MTSFLKKIAKAATAPVRGAARLVTDPKRAVRNIGRSWEKVDDVVLPAVGFALGGPAGAALGSAAARGVGDGKFNAGATLKSAATGYAGGQLASGLGLQGGKGFGALLDSGKGLVPGMGGGAGAPSVASAAPSVAGAGGSGIGSVGGGGIGGILKSVGGWAKDNPELLLGGISAIQGAQQQSKANKLQQQALDLAAQPWHETSALRAQALKSLMEPRQTDLSNIYSGSSNPFMRSLRG